MDGSEAEKIIGQNVSVTRQKIALMKGLLLKHFQPRLSGAIESSLRELDATRPGIVILDADADIEWSLRKAADWISYNLCASEAAWGLVHNGVFINLSSTVNTFTPSIEWKKGGYSTGWRFEEFKFRSSYPNEVERSRISDENQILADADLFLQRLSLPNIHSEVEEALRDATRCFRGELYMPCIVMLGKASEGAWIELGLALTSYAPVLSDAKAMKLHAELSSPDIGFARKLRDTVSFFEIRQAQFKTPAQACGVTLSDIRLAEQWADLLRDARNAIHHRVQSATNQTYETVALMLLAAMPHLRTIHLLHAAVI